ncbi:hypothetical protein [Lyngbya confervoides]|uniref:DUF2063 domain-containing protein n=1 Tax=Lyngbya confervoides BDU141951 TaxID=1574623 RepID=A0ABD4T154_9CYAN|nr:hypothetical protein [Lyngbya confervoides]MCM1982325.1 hypothetical protein [Lyngbya confervoides BDU141951]
MSESLPESLSALLTEAECAEIDQSLLPTRDRFSVRLKLYAARYLTALAHRLNTTVKSLSPDQIFSALREDPQLYHNGTLEEPFVEWFGNLLVASQSPLATIANQAEVSIEQLTLAQVLNWHRQQINKTP